VQATSSISGQLGDMRHDRFASLDVTAEQQRQDAVLKAAADTFNRVGTFSAH
jgi:hypothetical protein